MAADFRRGGAARWCGEVKSQRTVRAMPRPLAHERWSRGLVGEELLGFFSREGMISSQGRFVRLVPVL